MYTLQIKTETEIHSERLIVKNAARLFSSTGYNQTTIEMVAERSNVSPVTIYNNFENKTGLLLAVLIEEGAGIKETH